MPRVALPHLVHFTSSAPVPSVTTKVGLANKRDDSKTLAGMLLAAALAALLVVADQLIEAWVDGHLLLGWVALWTVTFAALALLAPPLRQFTSAMAATMARRSREAKERRAEEAMWEYACQDPRVMAELQHARTRSKD